MRCSTFLLEMEKKCDVGNKRLEVRNEKWDLRDFLLENLEILRIASLPQDDSTWAIA